MIYVHIFPLMLSDRIARIWRAYSLFNNAKCYQVVTPILTTDMFPTASVRMGTIWGGLL